jgi:2-methylcitrate dehydratase
MSYAVAGALMDGEVGLSQLTEEKIRNPEVHRFASKIRVVADPELQKLYPVNRPAIMEITTKDGKKFSGQINYAKGDFRNPMTNEELIKKFVDLATGVLGEKKAKNAVDLILNLENLGSLDGLIDHLK